jgi:hypothetical protein
MPDIYGNLRLYSLVLDGWGKAREAEAVNDDHNSGFCHLHGGMSLAKIGNLAKRFFL